MESPSPCSSEFSGCEKGEYINSEGNKKLRYGFNSNFKECNSKIQSKNHQMIEKTVSLSMSSSDTKSSSRNLKQDVCMSSRLPAIQPSHIVRKNSKTLKTPANMTTHYMPLLNSDSSEYNYSDADTKYQQSSQQAFQHKTSRTQLTTGCGPLPPGHLKASERRVISAHSPQKAKHFKFANSNRGNSGNRIEGKLENDQKIRKRALHLSSKRSDSKIKLKGIKEWAEQIPLKSFTQKKNIQQDSSDEIIEETNNRKGPPNTSRKCQQKVQDTTSNKSSRDYSEKKHKKSHVTEVLVPLPLKSESSSSMESHIDGNTKKTFSSRRITPTFPIKRDNLFHFKEKRTTKKTYPKHEFHHRAIRNFSLPSSGTKAKLSTSDLVQLQDISNPKSEMPFQLSLKELKRKMLKFGVNVNSTSQDKASHVESVSEQKINNELAESNRNIKEKCIEQNTINFELKSVNSARYPAIKCHNFHQHCETDAKSSTITPLPTPSPVSIPHLAQLPTSFSALPPVSVPPIVPPPAPLPPVFTHLPDSASFSNSVPPPTSTPPPISTPPISTPPPIFTPFSVTPPHNVCISCQYCPHVFPFLQSYVPPSSFHCLPSPPPPPPPPNIPSLSSPIYPFFRDVDNLCLLTKCSSHPPDQSSPPPTSSYLSAHPSFPSPSGSHPPSQHTPPPPPSLCSHSSLPLTNTCHTPSVQLNHRHNSIPSVSKFEGKEKELAERQLTMEPPEEEIKFSQKEEKELSIEQSLEDEKKVAIEPLEEERKSEFEGKEKDSSIIGNKRQLKIEQLEKEREMGSELSEREEKESTIKQFVGEKRELTIERHEKEIEFESELSEREEKESPIEQFLGKQRPLTIEQLEKERELGSEQSEEEEKESAIQSSGDERKLITEQLEEERESEFEEKEKESTIKEFLGTERKLTLEQLEKQRESVNELSEEEEKESEIPEEEIEFGSELSEREERVSAIKQFLGDERKLTIKQPEKERELGSELSESEEKESAIKQSLGKERKLTIEWLEGGKELENGQSEGEEKESAMEQSVEKELTIEELEEKREFINGRSEGGEKESTSRQSVEEGKLTVEQPEEKERESVKYCWTEQLSKEEKILRLHMSQQSQSEERNEPSEESEISQKQVHAALDQFKTESCSQEIIGNNSKSTIGEKPTNGVERSSNVPSLSSSSSLSAPPVPPRPSFNDCNSPPPPLPPRHPLYYQPPYICKLHGNTSMYTPKPSPLEPTVPHPISPRLTKKCDSWELESGEEVQNQNLQDELEKSESKSNKSQSKSNKSQEENVALRKISSKISTNRITMPSSQKSSTSSSQYYLAYFNFKIIINLV